MLAHLSMASTMWDFCTKPLTPETPPDMFHVADYFKERRKVIDKKEKKREQSRAAQRTYREFMGHVSLVYAHFIAGKRQKLRMEALEQALGPSADTVLSSLTVEEAIVTSQIPESRIIEQPTTPDTWLTNIAPTPSVSVENGRPALHRAASCGNESIVRMLLSRDADPAKQDPVGKTVLQLAVESGSESTVRTLLDAGVDVHMKDWQGRTALFTAVLADNTAIAGMLIEAGAEVDTRDALWDVPLHLAIELGFESMVLLLITNGADVNA
jgi:hypothetical protein